MGRLQLGAPRKEPVELLWTQRPEGVGTGFTAGGSGFSLALQVAVVIMCLVSIILYRAIMAVVVSKSENAFLSAWVSFRCLFFWGLLTVLLCLFPDHLFPIRLHELPASQGRW